VVTIVDHIWNELEHDIRYKTPTGNPNVEQHSLLKVLRDQLNGVTTCVDLLMEATEQQRLVNLVTIESAEDLSDALKLKTGQRLRGDFWALQKLLAGAFKSLTRADLDRLPVAEQHLVEGKALLEAAGTEVRDGVSLVIAALWPAYGRDFLTVIKGWPGRPGPVSRLLQELAKAEKEGRI
jgi:hypothetical protein